MHATLIEISHTVNRGVFAQFSALSLDLTMIMKEDGL
jgi:hypothetical protein